MKESLAKLDKNKIFYEPFIDEQSVRANGGVVVGGVVFGKGIATFAGPTTYIKYPQIPSTKVNEYTVSIWYSATIGAAMELFNSNSTNNSRIYLYANGTIGFWDSVAVVTASTIPTTSGRHNIIVSINASGNYMIFLDGVLKESGTKTAGQHILGNFYVGYLNSSNGSTASIESVDVFNTQLTVAESINLYNKKRYKKLSPHGEILGVELSPTYDFNLWIKNAGGIISTTTNSLTTTATGGIYYPYFTIGKIYKITISGTQTDIHTIRNLTSGADLVTLPMSFNDYVFYIYATATTLYYRSKTYGGTLIITSMSIKEVISTANLILDVDGFAGYPQNRLSNGLTGIDYSWQVPTSYSSPNMIVTPITDINGLYYNITDTVVGDSPRFNLGYGTYVAGKTYRCKLRMRSVNSITVTYYNTLAFIPIGTTTTEWKTYFIDIPVYGNMLLFNMIASSNLQIQFLSIKEIIPSIVNTAVSVVNSGGIKAMRFNGSTSKLDLGNYNSLTGDITMSCWFKLSVLSSADNYLFKNGKLAFDVVKVNRHIQVTSANWVGAVYVSAQNILKEGTYMNVIITRTSTGIFNGYVNGILNGTANQAGATPIAPTINATIGEGFNGDIAQFRVYQGILSQQEISQKFSSERSRYNV